MSDASSTPNSVPGSAPGGVGGAKETRYDPMDPFRAWRDTYLGAVAKTMSEVANTEAYAQANGAMLDNYLSVAGPYKEALDRSMLQALEQLSLPSRQDVISLAERFTNLELRMDDLDAKLDEIVKALRVKAPVSPVTTPEVLATAAPEASAASESPQVADEPTVIAAPELTELQEPQAPKVVASEPAPGAKSTPATGAKAERIGFAASKTKDSGRAPQSARRKIRR